MEYAYRTQHYFARLAAAREAVEGQSVRDELDYVVAHIRVLNIELMENVCRVEVERTAIWGKAQDVAPNQGSVVVGPPVSQLLSVAPGGVAAAPPTEMGQYFLLCLFQKLHRRFPLRHGSWFPLSPLANMR